MRSGSGIIILSLVANIVLVAALVFAGVGYWQLAEQHNSNLEELKITSREHALLMRDLDNNSAVISDLEDKLEIALAEIVRLKQ
tara:strand:- start:198 stop:449 length:252 start_codon:yes stop_codon:yes gene_type:complete